MQAHPEWKWCNKERRKSSSSRSDKPEEGTDERSEEKDLEDLKCREKVSDTETDLGQLIKIILIKIFVLAISVSDLNPEFSLAYCKQLERNKNHSVFNR